MMAIELNHTIVHSRDKRASATFLAAILDREVEPPWGPFLPLSLDNGVVLEFLEVDGAPAPQHYAFLVNDEVFDAAFARIQASGATFWADPFRREPGRINHDHGGRGVYFDDPDGHSMELMTAPYGTPPVR